MNRLLLTVILAFAVLWALPAYAALQYEESLKQLGGGNDPRRSESEERTAGGVGLYERQGIVTPIE